ncbi:SoxR reducing system RseC family protein [Chitiniphilus purpureus]|uniref:SoxR reducing system RseC family protein n=1 Tax=Chitiniphilus purpureus TaxID=2981137 RepID=A0ABY6DHG9_9NEIS|nr:SoxR reducing system RseC family protein [Chitiniphilus sp. CD1]UXY13767.1 SoxR reducing system RseC family protein [Chitiniphilus sp. CD1]
MSGWVAVDVRIVRVEGPYAWVRPLRQGSCPQCERQGGCHAVALTRLFGVAREVRVDNALSAQPGESVRIGLAARNVLAAACIAYGLPLAMLLAGALAGAAVLPTRADAGAVSGAGLGLLLAFALLRLGSPRWRHMPRMLGRAGQCGTVAPIADSKCSRFIHHKP